MRQLLALLGVTLAACALAATVDVEQGRAAVPPGWHGAWDMPANAGQVAKTVQGYDGYWGGTPPPSAGTAGMAEYWELTGKSGAAVRMWPAAELLPTVLLGVGAFALGWKIGRALDTHVLHFSGTSGDTFMDTRVNGESWRYYNANDVYAGQPAEWILVVSTVSSGVYNYYQRDSAGNCNALCTSIALASEHAIGRVEAHATIGCCATNYYTVRTATEMATYIGAPTSITEYAPGDTYTYETTGYAPQSTSAAVMCGAITCAAALAAAVAALSQQMKDWIDSTVAADPTSTQPAPTDWSIPDCSGVSQAVCSSALEDAAAAHGRAVTITTHVLTNAEADLTLPPAFVTTTQPSTGALVTVSPKLVILNVNPDPLPLHVLAPLAHETYPDYVDRLVATGYVGTTTKVEVDPALGDAERAEGEVIGTSPPGGTIIPPGQAVAVNVNPPGWGDPGPGPGGTCDCPPIDLTPLTTVPVSTKFPFGVFSYMGTVLGWFDVAAVPPSFSITGLKLPGSTEQLPPYAGNLGAFSPYMAIVRSLETWALWIGAIWYLGTRFLGFRGAEGVGDDLGNDAEIS